MKIKNEAQGTHGMQLLIVFKNNYQRKGKPDTKVSETSQPSVCVREQNQTSKVKS